MFQGWACAQRDLDRSSAACYCQDLVSTEIVELKSAYTLYLYTLLKLLTVHNCRDYIFLQTLLVLMQQMSNYYTINPVLPVPLNFEKLAWQYYRFDCVLI